MAKRTTNAGGVFLALGAILGTVGGSLAGVPTAGLIAGLILGGAGALIVWLVDRRADSNG